MAPARLVALSHACGAFSVLTWLMMVWALASHGSTIVVGAVLAAVCFGVAVKTSREIDEDLGTRAAVERLEQGSTAV